MLCVLNIRISFCLWATDLGYNQCIFLFERLEFYNNLLLTEQEGPTGYYHMTRTAPRVISSENVKKILFRAVRVEVIGPEKRVVKLETRTPRKIDAI